MSPDIPTPLIDAFRGGRGALFVGAGASVAAGLPDWTSLVKVLAHGLHPPLTTREELTASELMRVPQYFKNAFGREELVRRLRAQLQPQSGWPRVGAEIHDALCQVPTDLVYTTNFDKLIEQRLEAAHREYLVLASDAEVSNFHFPTAGRPTTVVRKIHGTIDRTDTIVITRDEFARFRLKHPFTIADLENHLRSRTFLFIGYSLQDPDFTSIYDNVYYQLRDAALKHYICLNAVDDHERRDLESRGLNPIALTSWGETKSERLLAFLTRLANETTVRHHILKFFPIPPREKVPLVVTSKEMEEKCFAVAAADLATAEQIGSHLQEISVDSDIVPASEFVANLDLYRGGDIVLICSPLGNEATRKILDDLKCVAGTVPSLRYEFVADATGDRIIGPEGAYRSDELPLSPDKQHIVNDNKVRTEYALVARYVNPWSTGGRRRYIFIFAGVRALGTQLIGKFLSEPRAYEELLGGDNSLGQLERVVKISYTQYDPLNFQWAKRPTVQLNEPTSSAVSTQ